MNRQEETVYEARVFLFGLIPLWKVKHTKKEWMKRLSLQVKRNTVLQVEFIDKEKG